MYPVKVTIRDTLKSQFLEDHIIKKAEKLNQYCQRISSCRVMVDMPQKHKHQGKLFRVSIELNVQGKELVVNRKLDEDVYVAVTLAFDAIERKLEDFSHRRVDNIRRRKRAANGNGFADKKLNGDTLVKGSNDELYLDEVDSDYEDIMELIPSEYILRE